MHMNGTWVGWHLDGTFMYIHSLFLKLGHECIKLKDVKSSSSMKQMVEYGRHPWNASSRQTSCDRLIASSLS